MRSLSILIRLLVVWCFFEIHFAQQHPGVFSGAFTEGKCYTPFCYCKEKNGFVEEMICASRKLEEWPVAFDVRYYRLTTLNLAFNRKLNRLPVASTLKEQLPVIERLVLTKSDLSDNCYITDLFRQQGVIVENPDCPGEYDYLFLFISCWFQHLD